MEVCVEEFTFRSRPATLRHGLATWLPENEEETSAREAGRDHRHPARSRHRGERPPDGLLVKTTGAERPFQLSEDESQLPDVLVYISVPKGKGGDVQRVPRSYIHPSIHPSIHACIHLSIHPSIHM